VPWLNWMFDLMKNHVVPVGKTYQRWWCGRFERSRCSSRSYPEPIHVTLSSWSCHLINQCSFLRKLNHPTLSSKNPGTEGIHLSVGGACLFSLFLGSSFYVYICHSCGALHAHWVCRVFSGPWDYSWCTQAGPDTHIKKKKKNLGTCLRIFVEN